MKAVWQRKLTVLCLCVCVFCVAAAQQTVLQRLNEELVNMHERGTLPCAPPDALAQRAMERHGTSKTLHYSTLLLYSVVAAPAGKPLGLKGCSVCLLQSARVTRHKRGTQHLCPPVAAFPFKLELRNV